MDLDKILEAQRTYFESGATLPVAARKRALTTFRNEIVKRQAEICQALKSDLGKSAQESYMTEIGLVLSEITFLKKHLSAWARPKRVKTPLSQYRAKSMTLSCPRGNVLILSPWNYPFLLTFSPAMDALAAGNTVLLKPSASAPATSEIIASICATCLPQKWIHVVTGGRAVNQDLWNRNFDMIFFTGGKSVGKLVYKSAAERLIPVVLELGGKSPCIVDRTADLKLAARRIVFGKFLNVGQTCVAPDYILVEQTVREKLLEELKREIVRQFGDRPLENPDYGKIINQKHFDRLCSYLEGELVEGGQCDPATLRIAPALLPNATLASACMQEEIFGPILPVLTFQTWEEAERILSANPTPLALYLFTTDRTRRRDIMHKIPFGGGCVNDTIIHLATSRMGFGGVGSSGLGRYHGKAGFDAFSYEKSLVIKKRWPDFSARYQPYSARKEAFIRRFLK